MKEKTPNYHDPAGIVPPPMPPPNMGGGGRNIFKKFLIIFI